VTNQDYRPRIPDDVRLEQKKTLHLLLHPENPLWAVVNATGFEVTRLCDGQHTTSDIVVALAQRWEQDLTVVQRDVEACLAALHRAGFLTKASAPLHAAQGTPAKRSWRLHIYLTERCNLRCRHCAVVYGPRPSDRLDSATNRALIDQAVASGVDGIAFSGGEPLLRPDLPDLLTYSARQVKTLLSTNGTLLDRPTAAGLVEQGVIVHISLDGATAAVHDAVRGQGTFERTWRGIAALQRCGIGDQLALNVTFMRHNIHQVPEIIALAAERGISGVRFSSLQRMGRASEHWSELAPTPGQYAQAYHYLYQQSAPGGMTISPGLLGLELEPPEDGMWCGLGKMLLVDSQGDIYPCSMLTAPQFKLGNVVETSLAEALASVKLHGLVHLQEQRKDEIEDCRACAWRHFCQAGCPASVWLQHGTFHATDDLCNLRRELFRELVFARATRAAQP